MNNMADSSYACRQGRGDPYYEGISIADVALKDPPDGSNVIEADTSDFIVVDALWFKIPDDIVAIDLSVNIDDYFNGARDIVTVHETGDIQDLRAIWTWENPNPPTGFYIGALSFSGVALEPDSAQTDKVLINGTTAVDADNYDSTANVAMNVVARARKIGKDAFL